LPEIYHIRDEEQLPPGQLEAFIGILDEVMSGSRDNIEALYHDLFIETCADWVVPYIADLVGTSHLSGDPWTLRSDVARTVFHRRRKGTLGAIESLTFSLSTSAAHAVEMRDRMVWNQHLNHQRPDAGGEPPLTLRTNISDAVRGGTVTLRDPALLTFINGAFDPFAHSADVKPGEIGMMRHNLPNLGIFLWRLKDYQVPVTQPGMTQSVAIPGADVLAGEAAAAVRAILHPQADPMILFNTHRFRGDNEPPDLSHVDAVPGPMPWPRLSQDTPSGNPTAYVMVDAYAGAPNAPGPDAVGLILHFPSALFPGVTWRFRGANLCAWEDGLSPPLQEGEIVVDPRIGRVLFGVSDQVAEADPLAQDLRVSYTYGFSGPTGGHPIARPPAPARWRDDVPTVVVINETSSADPLNDALANLQVRVSPLIIEIEDSGFYTLDLSVIPGVENVGGILSLQPGRSLWIRARSGERPVIFLEQPMRFRPADVLGPGAADIVANMEVRLEGLYVTWNRASPEFAGDEALIERAALHKLTLDGCTLDPGGAHQLDGTAEGTRQAMRPTFRLMNDYGFAPASPEELAFDQTPEIDVRRSIIGSALMEDGYELMLTDSIVDAGSGVGDAAPEFAVASAGADPANEWGPSLSVDRMTAFGRMRVERVTGRGGIWIHSLEAHDNQYGCIKFSYFSGVGDRLPPHHGCVFGTNVSLSFASELFGQPGYAQIRLRSDRLILEQGPERDAMGAFGYLINSHKWKNLTIRYREFLPVGIRPILLPVT
jgi:hypothetical protein